MQRSICSDTNAFFALSAAGGSGGEKRRYQRRTVWQRDPEQKGGNHRLRSDRFHDSEAFPGIRCGSLCLCQTRKRGIAYKPLDDLLRECDIISLHTPNNKETRGMISAEKIALMKKSAIFINCARGPIVDSKALAQALNEGRIAGAAVDVFDCEPPIPAEEPLLHAKNTLLTPHVAFLSEEAMVRRAKIEFSNVYAYLDGKPENVCAL